MRKERLLKRDSLVNWFIGKYEDLYINMMKCNHYYEEENPNIYHVEGSVWTHTLMVMTSVECSKHNYFERRYLVLLISSLCHDIGKVFTRQLHTKNDDVVARFSGHEGVSTMLSYSIISNIIDDFNLNLKFDREDFISECLKVISLHGVRSDIEIVDIFHKHDKLGAIRNTDNSEYPKRRFATPSNKSNGIKLQMFCGLPCSGKSTYTKYILENQIVVSRDDKLKEFYLDKFQKQSTYNEIFSTIHKDKDLLKEFDNSFDKFLRDVSKMDKDIIIDMTNLSLKSRRKHLSYFNSFDCECYVIIEHLSTILKRNDEREKIGKKFKEEIFLEMSKKFILPVESEGFSKVEFIYGKGE